MKCSVCNVKLLYQDAYFDENGKSFCKDCWTFSNKKTDTLIECSVCRNKIKDDDAFMDEDGNYYCEKCVPEDLQEPTEIAEEEGESFADFKKKCRQGPIMWHCDKCKKETMSDVNAYNLKWVGKILYFFALGISSIISGISGKFIIGLVVLMILSFLIKTGSPGYRVKSKCKECGHEKSMTVPAGLLNDN